MLQPRAARLAASEDLVHQQLAPVLAPGRQQLRMSPHVCARGDRHARHPGSPILDFPKRRGTGHHTRHTLERPQHRWQGPLQPRKPKTVACLWDGRGQGGTRSGDSHGRGVHRTRLDSRSGLVPRPSAALGPEVLTSGSRNSEKMRRCAIVASASGAAMASGGEGRGQGPGSELQVRPKARGSPGSKCLSSPCPSFCAWLQRWGDPRHMWRG